MESILAESSGVSLREREGRLLVVNHEIGWIYTVGFVLGLLTFIGGANAVILIAIFVTDDSAGISMIAILIVLTLSGGAGVLLKVVAGMPAKRRALPAEQLELVAVIDAQRGVLMDARQVELAPLDQVRVGTAIRHGSTAPSLVLRWPGGKLLLARGNVFAGGIEDLRQALHRHLSQAK